MLLIFPPVAKPCEPPAGIALLSSALKENGIDCKCVDANVDGLLWLINSVDQDKATGLLDQAGFEKTGIPF